jgi:hypothetical protein
MAKQKAGSKRKTKKPQKKPVRGAAKKKKPVRPSKNRPGKAAALTNDAHQMALGVSEVAGETHEPDSLIQQAGQSIRLNLQQFLEACREVQSVACLNELHIKFEANSQPADAFISQSPTCCVCLAVLPDFLLQLHAAFDSDSSKRFVGSPTASLLIRVVLNGPQTSNDDRLSDSQKLYLPLLLAACRDQLLADSATVQWHGSTMIGADELKHLWTESEDGEIISQRLARLHSGPFRISASDSIMVGKARQLLSAVSRRDLNSSPRANASRDYSVSRSHRNSTSDHLQLLTKSPSQETSVMRHPMNENQRGAAGFFSSPPPITPSDRRELRKHVINLNAGSFSTDGQFVTSEQDVAAIFAQHIPDWIETLDDGAPARVVFYAHGGLTNEAWGLYTAAFQRQWWKANGVYPVFFVWETGLMETLWQLFSSAERRMPFVAGGARGLSDWFDELEDKAWEIAARAAQGPTIWLGMKESARKTFSSQGDGLKVLDAAKKFATKFGDRAELHAVGHSAGSIILSHAMVAAQDKKLPKFESVHFLAPAVTNELFRNTLMPLVGGQASDQVNHLTLFTMANDFERDDTVGPYDKSLLYLIYNALEPKKETPILGLEISLVSDTEVARFFGLSGGRNNARTEVIFSQTPQNAKPDSRSLSVTHGGFDNDPATMGSVLRRIIKAKDSDSVTPFPTDRGLTAASLMPPVRSTWEAAQASVVKIRPISPEPPEIQTPPSGRRKALCIGINAYPQQPLGGCVNDSNNWKAWLESRGFPVQQLLDTQATREAILGSIQQLFATSTAGDILVIQFAGHGTQVEDLNGDEFQGDTPGKDEALVPVDFLQNGLVLDDDLGELCRKIPSGVSVTFFMDCCHSGTNTRLFMSAAQVDADERARFLRPTPEMIAAHKRSRGVGARGMRSFSNPYQGGREILFAACQSNEVALESAGNGDFTRNAMKVLAQNYNLNAEEFLFEVKQQFGVAARQTPGLWCDPALRKTPLAGGISAP